MKINYLIIKAISVVVMLFTLCSCANNNAEDNNPDPVTAPPTQPDLTESPQAPTDNSAQGELVITFDYENQSGWASNQFAVWIEDMDGNFIATLYATRWTANGGYKTRSDSIPVWVERSGIDSMAQVDVDAVSGATPRAGTQTYTWDLTDANGDAVPVGEYKIFVEGTLRWKNQVMFSGVINSGESSVIIEPEANFTFEASDGQDALTEDSPEINMITNVKITLN